VRAACVASCLAILLVGHCSEAVGSFDADSMDTELVSLASDRTTEGRLESQLRRVGAAISKAPATEVASLLSKSFTPSMWKMWHKESAPQNLDFAGNVAVLNSYLCANVADGSKVMRVIKWVKQALHSQHSSSVQAAKQQRRIAELRQRANDAQLLAEQTQSPEAVQLVHKMQHDLAEALDTSEDGSKSSEGKKTDQGKKTDIGKKAAKEKKADKGTNPSKAAQGDGHSENSSKKFKEVAGKKKKSRNKLAGELKELQRKRERVNIKTKPAKLRVSEKEMKAMDSSKEKRTKKMNALAKKKEKDLKRNAKKLDKESAKDAEKARTEAADASLTKNMMKMATNGRKQEKLESKFSHQKKKEKIMEKVARAAARKAATAEQAAAYKPLSFEVNIATDASQLKERNEKLIETEKRALAKLEKRQNVLVHKKVAAIEKVHLAEGTLSHAKLTKDPKLIKNAMELVAAAKKHSKQITADVTKAGKALTTSGQKLAKLGAQQSNSLAGVVKERIRRTVQAARKLEKRARLVILAQKAKMRASKRTAKAMGEQAAAAGGAADLARKKATDAQEAAQMLSFKAKKARDKFEPFEEKIEIVQENVRHDQQEVRLARQSSVKQALDIATAKARVNMKNLNQLTKKLKKLGRTPVELVRLADQKRDQAKAERDAALHARKAAKEFDESEVEARKATQASKKEIASIEKHYLPRVIRHVHTRIAFIEHSLAMHLEHVKALKQVKVVNPSKVEMLKVKELQVKVAADNAASKVKLANLGKLRDRLKLMRDEADKALSQAKDVEDTTHAAIMQIEGLKKNACSRVSMLKKELMKRKKAKDANAAYVEKELGRAKKACAEASTTLVTARAQMRTRAKAVSAAALEAKHMEAKYAAEERHLVAKMALSKTKKAVVVKAEQDQISEEESAVNDMIKQAKGKVARATLMFRAAQKTKNKAALETASADSAAAKLHLAKLVAAKAKLAKKLHKSNKELGELHSQIHHDAKEVKHVEDQDVSREVELGSENNEAMQDAATTAVDRLKDQLATETALRESEETSMTNTQMQHDKKVVGLEGKVNSLSQASLTVIKYMKNYIHHGAVIDQQNTAEDAKVKSDMHVANAQLGKLQRLLHVAEGAVTKAKSRLKLAQQSKNPKAVDLAMQKLKTAQADVTKVQAGLRAVQDRRDSDSRKLTRHAAQSQNGAVAESAVSKFAKNVVSRWESVHAKAQKITQTPGFNQDKELEKRIAALEGALHEAGGKLVNEKEHEKTEDMELLRSQIAVAQGKLKSGQSKMEALKKHYASAKQQNNKHVMIKTGTQEKDLSVEVDGLKDHIKELQARLRATATSTPTPSLPPMIDPAVKEAQRKIKAKLHNVKAAVAQAKDASMKRAELKKQADNLRAKLTGAVRKEKSKLDKAKKAKQDLKVSLKQASQEQQTLKHKFDQEKHQLEAQGKQIAQEEQKAKQNQALVKSKINSAQKSISELQTVAQKTEAENSSTNVINKVI